MKLSRIACSLVFTILFGHHAYAAERVKVIATPADGQVPDAEVDPGGTIHIAYVAGKDAWYVKATDDGKISSAPLRINSEPGTVHPPNMFRGPDLALGKDGRVHVIWYVSAYQRKLPKDEWGVFYSSRDPGKSEFAASRNLNHKPSDNYSLAADEKGNVAVVWMAGKIVVSFSEDNGASFKDLSVPIADPCECCASRALFTGNSVLAIAYREKENNMRDMHLLRKQPGQSSFTRQKVSSVPWQINACPMTGAFLANGKTGPVMAWETRGAISYARIDAMDSLTTPKEIKAAAKGKWPIALSAPDGAVLVSWKNGNTLAWQLHDSADKPVGDVQSKPSRNSNRHAGVVTKTGDFLLID
jgi:hypothetical protein